MKQSFEKYIIENHSDMNEKPYEDSEAEIIENVGNIQDSLVKREPEDEFEYGVSHLEGSFEAPSGYGGCLRHRWACLHSSCLAKNQHYCGPIGPKASIFYEI